MYSKCLKQNVCYVIVYSIGCPYPMYYGESCNLPCPTFCKNRRCHIVTGKCFVCEDGYLGSTCNDRKYWRWHPKSDSVHYQFHHAIYIPVLWQLLHNSFFKKYFSMVNTLNWVTVEGMGMSHWHILFSLLCFSSSRECFQIVFLITNPDVFVNFIIYIFFRRTLPYKSVKIELLYMFSQCN